MNALTFEVNGVAVSVSASPLRRLSDVLREDLRLPGTKVGCDAGDCGACTVLLDDEQVCACMVPLGQAAGRRVLTVEGLARDGELNTLQRAFHHHGAAQCGICTPGMLMAATDLLRRNHTPTATEVMDALAGVLCRCTGYRKIVEAVLSVASGAELPPAPPAGGAVGARLPKVDGVSKLTGAEAYGADRVPEGSLRLRAVRSPHARARFTVGDLTPLYRRFPGLVRVLAASDIPGANRFGVYPDIKDQPVLAEREVRYRGEAVLALVGDMASVCAITDTDVPIEWHVLEPITGIDAALRVGATAVQPSRPDNVLVRGRLRKGEAEAAIDAAPHVAEGRWRTGFVEHAYIELEAGHARRVGDRLEITVTTQAPYMNRHETARTLGLEPSQVRIIPTACGGGFGGKLDLSIQPLVGLAAWLLDRPVCAVYTRAESMASTTKRHPARIGARAACDTRGRLTAFRFHADFDTGAYASWGPTVADRVPLHCTGPYFVPHVMATTTAVFTNAPPAGAFRGFGVPQAAIAHEALMDMLAEQVGMDPLEFRLRNALRPGQTTPSGQALTASVGARQCLQALQSRWLHWRETAEQSNRGAGPALRRGVGIGCIWYGCGTTSMPNPSAIEVGIAKDGTVTLYSGAVDIGQGANTVLIQICADALGIEATRLRYVMGDTDRTADAGKTSATRQTFVSGKAAQLAGTDLRRQILRMTNASATAEIEIADGRICVNDDGRDHSIDLATLPVLPQGDVLRGTGNFDPPTTSLDEDGQGEPYATYAFGAQIAEVEVDTELGTVKVLRMAAAHDVGKAVNPTQVEGQIHGGIAQGLGYALMEDYVPGRTENLHDYLIPTFGDMPEIETLIIENPEPLGPYGAKGVAEPTLIPTPAAILGAICHATGVRIHQLPATPDRVRAAILARACLPAESFTDG